MILYTFIVVLTTVLAAILWPRDIRITPFSLIPVMLALLMALQAWFFRNEPIDPGFSTAYGWDIPPKEQNKRLKSMSLTLRLAIPLQLPLILFFPSSIKLISIALYLLSIIAAPLIDIFHAKVACKRRTKKSNPLPSPASKNDSTGNDQPD